MVKYRKVYDSHGEDNNGDEGRWLIMRHLDGAEADEPSTECVATVNSEAMADLVLHALLTGPAETPDYPADTWLDQ